jgi:hypothetical protein
MEHRVCQGSIMSNGRMTDAQRIKKDLDGNRRELIEGLARPGVTQKTTTKPQLE